jgi:hypothetical protein
MFLTVELAKSDADSTLVTFKTFCFCHFFYRLSNVLNALLG